MMRGLSRNSIMSRLTRRILLKSIKIKARLSRAFDNYPFLTNRKTRIHIRTSKVLFMMRGLPGSGKSTLVRALKLRYKNAVVVSADNYFSQEDGTYEFSREKLSEAHENCQKMVELAAEKGLQHIVVDNTNIMHWEMGKYFRLASLYNYVVLVVEPRTPWAMDAAVLATKNTHNVPEEHIRLKMKKFRPIFPVYWAWFLNETASKQLVSVGESAFNLCVKNVPEFSKYMNEQAVAKGFTVPISFQEYYQRDSGKATILHCTAFFSGYKKNRHPKTEEYASREEVTASTGRAFDLKLVAVMITPRTVGIRVVLNRSQLALWGNEDLWSPIIPSASKKSSDGDESPLQKDDIAKSETENPQKMKKNKNYGKKSKNPASNTNAEDVLPSVLDATREQLGDAVRLETENVDMNLISPTFLYSDDDTQFKPVVQTDTDHHVDRQNKRNSERKCTDPGGEFSQDLLKNSDESLSDDMLTLFNAECTNERTSDVDDLTDISLSNDFNGSTKELSEHFEPLLQSTTHDTPIGVNTFQSECFRDDSLNTGERARPEEVSESLSTDTYNFSCIQNSLPSENSNETSKIYDVSKLGDESNHSSEIPLEKGSRAHITLGFTEGYEAVHTGFDQMELLICEENDSLVGEAVVTDDVTILHYGEGRCAVYFDWPMYKSALFAGEY